MSAICDAARRGVPLTGSTLYVTTYPCHMCARLIIAAAVARVVYVDPYAKSLVAEMYEGMIDGDGPLRKDRVRFEAFIGVSPIRFASLFTSINRQRSTDGRFASWEPARAQPRVTDRDLTGADAAELAVVARVGSLFVGADSQGAQMRAASGSRSVGARTARKSTARSAAKSPAKSTGASKPVAKRGSRWPN
jgi:hypothetical protein